MDKFHIRILFAIIAHIRGGTQSNNQGITDIYTYCNQRISQETPEETIAYTYNSTTKAKEANNVSTTAIQSMSDKVKCPYCNFTDKLNNNGNLERHTCKCEHCKKVIQRNEFGGTSHNCETGKAVRKAQEVAKAAAKAIAEAVAEGSGKTTPKKGDSVEGSTIDMDTKEFEERNRESCSNSTDHADSGDIDPLQGAATGVSEFGYRTYWKFGQEYTDFHGGIDFSAPQGTTIVSPWHGTVLTVVSTYSPDFRTKSGDMTSYGNYAKIQTVDNNGKDVIYIMAHMLTVAVSAGMLIHPYTIIGQVGSTGNSSGPHLHLDVRYVGSSDRHNPRDGMNLPYL